MCTCTLLLCCYQTFIERSSSTQIRNNLLFQILCILSSIYKCGYDMKPTDMFRGCLTPVNILDPTISYRQSFREQKTLQVRQFLLETNLGATEDIHEVKGIVFMGILHLKLHFTNRKLLLTERFGLSSNPLSLMSSF